MNESTVYEKFNGYHAYPIMAGEQLIRGRLIELFDRIINKNETCLARAREKGLEKLMSRILAVKKRMERIRGEMTRAEAGAEYKIEAISPGDEAAIKEVDTSLESVIRECLTGIESLTCLETDMHICERFASMDDSLRAIEYLFHRRVELFKKMRVYG